MIALFVGLTMVNLSCLLAAALLGYVTGGRHEMAPWHMLCGAIGALVCCAVHCIVFTYFIATAKWVQHAITVKRLDEGLGRPTRSFRAQAFPAALAAMGMVFATAVMGAAVDNYGISIQWHHLIALAMIATNAGAALVEYGAIRRNAMLIDRILAAPVGARAEAGELRT